MQDTLVTAIVVYEFVDDGVRPDVDAVEGAERRGAHHIVARREDATHGPERPTTNDEMQATNARMGAANPSGGGPYRSSNESIVEISNSVILDLVVDVMDGLPPPLLAVHIITNVDYPIDAVLGGLWERDNLKK